MEGFTRTARKFYVVGRDRIFCLGIRAAHAASLESLVIAYPTTSSQFTPLWFARDDEIAEREPLAKKATIDQVFDLTIARKLDKEGFFKTVFKR